ncbi:zinc finger protein 250-like [Thalassophryne amazonica]|uniref:zinc finger protein 250-like n=1 Tax=Thalassophryne amazonica TaxID=390379 RepID=UPI001472197C|nr:zinc finger protein 250-like [Thalassophryne amazonica]
MEMFSSQSLRNFINERLCAVADEIFGVFEQTLVVFEEEILRQRRVIDMVYRPDTNTTEFPQPHPCTRDGFLEKYQQSNQERSFSPGQEDREPPQIKEEEQELITSQEDEPLILKKEDHAANVTPLSSEESGSSEDRTLRLDSNQTMIAEEKLSQPPAEALPEWMQSDSDREAAMASEPRVDHSPYVRSCKKVHARVQMAEKSYSCVYCKKDFRCSSSLKRHLRVHTGEKPYECFMCGKRFNVSTTLKVHYRIHTGEKPYKCKHCDKAFTTCSNLKKHVALHTGTK